MAPYRPKHVSVVVTKEQMRQGLVLFVLIAAHKALFALCWFTGARPASEPCRLTWGDVDLGKRGEWGSVVYRRTKTGSTRTVPLHPEACEYLAEIRPAVPFMLEARQSWNRQPVFPKRGMSTTPWDASSY